RIVHRGIPRAGGRARVSARGRRGRAPSRREASCQLRPRDRAMTVTGRNQSLDVLRGIAVSMVLLVHLPLAHGTPRLLSLGSYGVALFFVLSGFLISGLLYNELQKNGRLDLPRFWIRRGLKIWPSYFAAYVPLFLLGVVSAVRHDGLTSGVAKVWGALPNF